MKNCDMTEPKTKNLYFEYKDGNRIIWKVRAHFKYVEKSNIINDADFYYSQWEITIQKDRNILPIKFEVQTQYDMIPNKLDIVKAFNDYFSNFILGFAVDSNLMSFKRESE